jgi:hypothetical protein
MTYDQYLAMERDEMLRHKWIESQKAGHDLGQSAFFDWVDKHADAFRHYIVDVRREHVEWDRVGERNRR